MACHASIKIAIFRTLKRFNTTWNLLVASPGSLLMNMSIENIVCVHRVYEKEGFWTTHVSCCRSCASSSWQAKSVDPWVQPDRHAWGAVYHYSPACQVALGDRHFLSAITATQTQTQTMFSMLLFVCRDPSDATSKSFMLSRAFLVFYK